MTRILILLLGLLYPAPAAASDVSSPRLEKLRAAIGTDHRALEKFWQEVQQSGTPLVEPAPDDASEVLVTFLWRGDENLSDVVVFASVLPDNDPARQRLKRLAGTDVWYRTYRFRRDLPIL